MLYDDISLIIYYFARCKYIRFVSLTKNYFYTIWVYKYMEVVKINKTVQKFSKCTKSVFYISDRSNYN